jgi:hypothetical protein
MQCQGKWHLLPNNCSWLLIVCLHTAPHPKHQTILPGNYKVKSVSGTKTRMQVATGPGSNMDKLVQHVKSMTILTRNLC